MLKLFPLKTTISKAYTYKECLELYYKNNYENIFINFDFIDGKKIIEKIIEKNPKQKLLLLNSKEYCLTSEDCKL